MSGNNGKSFSIRRLNYFIFAFLVAPLCAAAAQPFNTPVSGPALGYVWDDAAKAIRPIKGMPGAAVAAAPIYSDSSLVTGAISPDQGTALLLNASGTLLCLRLGAGAPPVPIASGYSNATRIVFSPSANSALIFQPGRSQFLSISGLPDQPSIKEIDPQGLPGPIAAAAVSDSGIEVVGVSNGASGNQIFAVNADGLLIFISGVKQLGGMQFLRQTNDLLLTDEAANTLWLFRAVDENGSVLVLATAKDGLAQPSFVAASSDNLSAWVMNSAGQSLIQIGIVQPRLSSQIDCHCQVAALEPLHGRAVFRLTGIANGQFTILDAGSAKPRILSVPVIPINSTIGAQQ